MLGLTWEPTEGLNLAGTRFVEQTPWPKPINWLPVSNFRELFEELSENITLSMFALDNLSYLRVENDTLVQFDVTGITYAYDRQALILTYGISLVLALFALICGVFAFLENGVSMSSGFASFMATTRNPDLDRIVDDSCNGAQGTLEEFKDVKLRFGRPRHGHRTAFARDSDRL